MAAPQQAKQHREHHGDQQRENRRARHLPRGVKLRNFIERLLQAHGRSAGFLVERRVAGQVEIGRDQCEDIRSARRDDDAARRGSGPNGWCGHDRQPLQHPGRRWRPEPMACAAAACALSTAISRLLQRSAAGGSERGRRSHGIAKRRCVEALLGGDRRLRGWRLTAQQRRRRDHGGARGRQERRRVGDGRARSIRAATRVPTHESGNRGVEGVRRRPRLGPRRHDGSRSPHLVSRPTIGCQRPPVDRSCAAARTRIGAGSGRFLARNSPPRRPGDLLAISPTR